MQYESEHFQGTLSPVQTEQDARLLLLPLQTQSLLRVVWLSHYSAEIATLSHVLNQI